MLQLGSRLAHMYIPWGPSDSSLGSSTGTGSAGGSVVSTSSNCLGLDDNRVQSTQERIPSLQDFIKHVRRVSGLKKEDIFCNLRVPNQFQTAREEITLVIVTGAAVYCMDVKQWSGTVSAPGSNKWHIQVKEEEPNFTNTSIQQVPDLLQAIMTKARDLCNHMKRCGVNIRQSLFLPRVLFLSPHCHLDEQLSKRKELISHSDVEEFVHSLRESYVAWVTDALVPSWLSGHLSFRQLGAVRQVLGQMGTWDVVKLCSGVELKGDYQGCQHLALNRQETDILEFRRGGTLPADTLWALLGYTPQCVTLAQASEVRKKGPVEGFTTTGAQRSGGRWLAC
ncbi:uncharacterized protein LOC143510457 isoform X3 [Brachyhypopomus gauderio]|uniref:uncharacterized protein LOC143510457 isoform X3 n=1 Tax=Brachyhypopomus gauderio TaxID=698409 RepID=UPI0040416496